MARRQPRPRPTTGERGAGQVLRQPQLEEPQPRTIEQPCSKCGQFRPVMSGAHFRRLRELSKVTLTEMARICRVGSPHLSRMERGLSTFQPRFAELYQRLFDRRQKSLDES